MSLWLATRHERAFERSYDKHVGDVYHYALGVLTDPLDAEEVTQATFLDAYRTMRTSGSRPQLNSLLGIAHEVCRERGGHPRPAEAELLGEEELEGSITCSGAELAISRHLDDQLSRSERRLLRAHLRSCSECESFARRQYAQRAAIRSIASLPLPETLKSDGAWAGRVKELEVHRKFRADPASP
jgi:DNA-directed RNA polymerase specialized sigma24 family protein